MWPFGKVEWTTARMPMAFVDDPADEESMIIEFEAVGNPDGECRYFSVTYCYPGGDDAVEEYERLREALRGIGTVQVDVSLKYRNGKLRDFRITTEALAVATGCEACRRLEQMAAWGMSENSRAIAQQPSRQTA